MKKLIFGTIFFVLFSCEKEGEIVVKNQNQVNEISTIAVLNSVGNFIPTPGISVSGQAKIYTENNVRKVVLENFNISSGPDLKEYLSTADIPNNFVNLGNLASNTTFNIPAQVNLAQYKYVLIHCQQYNHLFAIALLN